MRALLFRTWPLLLLAALAALALPARAQGDDISAASRSVVRVVVVAVENGEVVGFGHGSGFAVAPNRIVTNAHVVALAVQYPKDVIVGVVPSEGSRSYGARVVRVDPGRDLALLEMEQGTLPPVPLFLGRIPDGSDVVALGYPGNVDLATAQSADDYINPLPATRSRGNYSNERMVNGVAALLHTASIARGNSGGPLLDQCGRVIGVNTAITRADEGDSTFAFAIANREVAAFLRASGQAFAAVSSECVSMAERLAQDRARSDAEAREREAALAAAERGRQQQLENARAEIQESRENRVALAILLMVLAVVSLGAALVMLQKDKLRPAWILLAVGGAFIVAAAVTFMTRPGYDDLQAAAPARPAAAATSANPSAAFAGRHLCRIVPERSRVTVSSSERVELEWSETGCVNGRTQYAQDGEVWHRILVPQGDQTVSVLEVRPGSREYVVNRYLLPAEAMSRARALRRRIDIAACTAEEPRRAALAAGQEQIRQILPERPNERLVYDCTAAD
ncbi:MAG TPA: trypsin-like peptidase domain-containing protein [Allosphingosinicella sp.]|jgi:S1-C subfamily serine protease